MQSLQDRINLHLQKITHEIGSRPVGSKENHQAAEYIEDVFRTAGLEVELQEFEVPNWEVEEAYILMNGDKHEVRVNTFSEPCHAAAEVIPLCTLEELRLSSNLTGKIVFLYGELSKENYVPKGFSIYNPEHHQEVIRLLEEKNPAAVITVRMEKGSDLPIFSDWDFKIPSITITPELGVKVKNHTDALTVLIKSNRIPGKTRNVIGRIEGKRPEKIILTAHYDTVFDTNGAFDNGSGVSVMLLLAEELAHRSGLDTSFECIAFSSEEYLGLGDQVYLNDYQDSLDQAIVAINVDGVGQTIGTNNLTLMAGSSELEQLLKSIKSNFPSVEWNNPWYASNHFTFFSNGVPSIPFNCNGVSDILHTPNDQSLWICPDKLIEVYELIMEIITSIQGKTCEWTREKNK
ncbi:aminopeptidase YwaD [Bacillus carboniphilus]|uniref:Aminopeptidase YwaD n=1 Tax=Bacillus carboniphilus TaxID=86663 RepID=A0ABN0WJQ4_9BACI